LQGGLPTDRLVAEWWLKSQRVVGLLEKGGVPPGKTEQSIAVPAQVYEWKSAAETRDQAVQTQEHIRRQFAQAFSEGFVVLGYERDSQKNGKFLLGQWNESWSYS
jgi:predicted GNAT superfamily acetyltransferase